MARARVHQHVNPLAKYFREIPVEPLDVKNVFDVPDLPLHLDIGCARGRFILEMAQVEEAWNFLGVEIREPLVEDANHIRDDEGLGNLHYEFCNATFDLAELLKELPSGILRDVSIQFPDPWFKKKHAKRRMVNQPLIEAVETHLAEEGRIVLQTDVEFLLDEMLAIFEESGIFSIEELAESPYQIKTEREKAVENKGEPVYRYELKRNT